MVKITFIFRLLERHFVLLKFGNWYKLLANSRSGRLDLLHMLVFRVQKRRFVLLKISNWSEIVLIQEVDSSNHIYIYTSSVESQ